jgi:hypothetical protein
VYRILCIRAYISKQMLGRPEVYFWHQYNFAGSITMVFASRVGHCPGRLQLRGKRRFERPRRGTDDQGRAARTRNGGTVAYVPSRSGPFGSGRVHGAAKPRSTCRQFLHSLHSHLAEEFAEFREADRIWPPRIRPGSLVFHNQETIRQRQQPFQEQVLLPNEVQGVRHENSIDRWKVEAGAPQIPQNLTNLDAVIPVRNFLQRFLVQIDGMNRAAGSQQLRKRGCERASAATKITPVLRSHPFNKGCTDERGGPTDLHLSTVLLTDDKSSRYQSGPTSSKPVSGSEMRALKRSAVLGVRVFARAPIAST